MTTFVLKKYQPPETPQAVDSETAQVSEPKSSKEELMIEIEAILVLSGNFLLSTYNLLTSMSVCPRSLASSRERQGDFLPAMPSLSQSLYPSPLPSTSSVHLPHLLLAQESL